MLCILFIMRICRGVADCICSPSLISTSARGMRTTRSALSTMLRCAELHPAKSKTGTGNRTASSRGTCLVRLPSACMHMRITQRKLSLMIPHFLRMLAIFLVGLLLLGLLRQILFEFAALCEPFVLRPVSPGAHLPHN